MHDTQSLLTIILESIFVGFGIVIPLLNLIRTSNLKTIEVKDLFILTAVQTVRLAGIAYFLYWIVASVSQYGQGILDSRLFGPYWWASWYKPTLILLLSGVFWFKKTYYRKTSRIVFAILLFILPSLPYHIDRFRDVSSFQIPGYLMIGTLLNIIVFIFIIFTIMLAGGKLKKK